MKNLTKLTQVALSVALILSLTGCETPEDEKWPEQEATNSDGMFNYEIVQDYPLSQTYLGATEYHFREVDESGDNNIIICIEESRLVKTTSKQYPTGSWDLFGNVLEVKFPDAKMYIDWHINSATTYNYYNIDVVNYGSTVFDNSIRSSVYQLRAVWKTAECKLPNR